MVENYKNFRRKTRAEDNWDSGGTKKFILEIQALAKISLG